MGVSVAGSVGEVPKGLPAGYPWLVLERRVDCKEFRRWAAHREQGEPRRRYTKTRCGEDP